MNAHPLDASPESSADRSAAHDANGVFRIRTSTAGRLARRLIPGLFCVLTLYSCQSAGGPTLSRIARPVNATLDADQGVLGVGDVIEVRFPYQPTWNQEITVARDGSASFMAIGRMVVAGMTLDKLDKALTDAYTRVFEKPDLAVVLKSLGERKVYVMGEVEKPGEILLGSDRRLTFVQALAQAGGPRKESAYLAHTLLIRWSATNEKQLSWKIDARAEHWTGPEPLYLQPYDVIYVPNTPIDEVAIWVDNYIRRLIPFPDLIPPPTRI